MEKNELVLVNAETGLATISEKVVVLMDDFYDRKAQIEQEEAQVREALLTAMVNNNVVSAKVGPYTFSQVIPKDVVTFNSEACVKYLFENDPLAAAEVVSTSTSYEFDADKFIAENPEIAAKYMKKVSVNTVDEKKIKKLYPSCYEQFTTTTKSEKPITLRIVKK